MSEKFNIDSIQKEITSEKNQWVKVDNDKEWELLFNKLSSQEFTSTYLELEKKGATQSMIQTAAIYNVWVDWRNVKLKDVISENLKDSLLESEKITEQDLEKEVGFGRKIFDDFVSLNGLQGQIIVLLDKIAAKKKQKLNEK